jgi:hypothetical protein
MDRLATRGSHAATRARDSDADSDSNTAFLPP